MKKLLLMMPVIFLLFIAAAQKKENNKTLEYKLTCEEVDSLISPIELPNDIIRFHNGIEYVPVLALKDNGDVLITDVLVITANLLLEYKQECFNDSVLVKVNINPDRNTTSESGITTGLYYPPVWVKKWQHKTPTFEDFLNWIEERSKK